MGEKRRRSGEERERERERERDDMSRQGVHKIEVPSLRASSLSRRCLSRVRVPVRATPPPRKHSEGRERGRREREDEREGGKVFKGLVSASLALTQVMGSALAVHDHLNLDATQNESIQTLERQATSKKGSGVGRNILGRVALPGQLAQVAPPIELSISSPQEAGAAAAQGAKEVDLYRDTLVRYAGYANEVGESFKNLISRTSYRMSYAIAICYVLADATDKGLKAESIAIAAEVEAGKASPALSDAQKKKNPQFEVAIAAVDTLVWQAMASVIIPGFVVNRIVWASKNLVESDKIAKLPPMAKKWAPTLVGLSFIPFIVHPIDEGVTRLLDMTIRQFY